MSKTRNLASSLSLYLVVAIVFLVALLFTNLIGAPVIAVLTYLVLQYRRRNKDLEQRLGTATPQTAVGAQDIPPPPETPVPPMSTDA